LPGLRRTDFRFETYSTWLYRGDEGGRFFYWNDQYRDAYTNNGYLLGSWIGRDARAYQVSSTYWWSAKNKVVGSFRQTKTGSMFLPGGGSQSDLSISGQWQLQPDVIASPFLQFERYSIPVLGAPKRDLSVGLEITFYPKNLGLTR
jgi:hypothetical protein